MPDLSWTSPHHLNYSSPRFSAPNAQTDGSTQSPRVFSPGTRRPRSYAAANQEELEELIRPTGFYRNKATTLIGMGATLETEFGGEVPENSGRVGVALPGVGRKTAFVVLGNAYGLPGITIDTHFGRLARRFGWTVNTDPVKIERDIERTLSG